MFAKKKVNPYAVLEQVPPLERYGICLIALLAIFLYVPPFPFDIRSMVLVFFVFTNFLQIAGFFCRLRQRKYYNKTYNAYLIAVLLFVVLFISTTFINVRFGGNYLLLMPLAIASILLLTVLSFWSAKTAILYFFHWHLKKVFPDERAKEPITRASLKKLSKYIDIEKQRIYLIVQYGEKLILYGFSIYFTLWVIKTHDFQGVALLSEMQGYLSGWTAINFSVLLSLFSILLALLTICWPVQARIIEEAEKRLAEKFG